MNDIERKYRVCPIFPLILASRLRYSSRQILSPVRGGGAAVAAVGHNQHSVTAALGGLQ